MCSLKLFLVCALVALVSSADDAKPCDANACVLPKCTCSGTVPVGNIPQLVALSFDDSTSKLISNEFYETELFTRKNPDGCPISGTFYVPHEYTDYSVVNNLYNHGFEIGSHSITKNYSAMYWNSAPAALIEKEMYGQKLVITKFANIPDDSITGARIPHFQLNGDETYSGLEKFAYDNSWPTYSFKTLFPYTLDYASTQDCLVGTCPKKPHPGLWVVPINNWKGMDEQECNKLLGCVVKGDSDELFSWMMENFERNYNSTRAPLSLSINYAWFTFTANSLNALQKFLDHLKTKEDVFVVSNVQLLNWIKNPVAADKFSSCQDKRSAPCKAVSCQLNNEDGDIRYMASCVPCPKSYPSLDDPLGEKK